MFQEAVPWFRRLVAGLSSRRPAFDPSPVHVGLVKDKVTVAQAPPPQSVAVPWAEHDRTLSWAWPTLSWTWSYLKLSMTVRWTERDRTLSWAWPYLELNVIAPWAEHDRTLSWAWSYLKLSITVPWAERDLPWAEHDRTLSSAWSYPQSEEVLSNNVFQLRTSQNVITECFTTEWPIYWWRNKMAHSNGNASHLHGVVHRHKRISV